MKKDTWKWFEFSKSPTHNTNQCHAMQSLVTKLKASDSNAYFDFVAEPHKGNDTTISTTNVQKTEPKDPKEGECLFHSQMWVKASLLQFIIDNEGQKNLILAEAMKWLGVLTTPHP